LLVLSVRARLLARIIKRIVSLANKDVAKVAIFEPDRLLAKDKGKNPA